MNLHKMAQRITLLEGKKKSVNIGQVKEILKLVMDELATYPIEEVEETLKRYRREVQ